MQNFRAKRASLYNMKTTVKHNIPIKIEPTDVVNIKQINISDKDKKGNIVYQGSGGGGLEKPRKSYSYTIESLKLVKCKSHYYTGSWFERKKHIITIFRIVRINRDFNKPQCIGKVFEDFGIKYRIISQNQIKIKWQQDINYKKLILKLLTIKIDQLKRLKLFN